MTTVNLKITCNGTEQEIIDGLRELLASYEQVSGVYNYEDATVMAEVEED